MTLFLTLLPLYLLGNLHCAGMCGPLVMMLGRHRYRHLYFAGRTLSFSFAGMLAGEVGALTNAFSHVGETACFLFGGGLVLIGMLQLLRLRIPMPALGRVNQKLSLLLLKDRPSTTLAFGLSTVLLPCGQTLMVFTACAIAGSPWVGLANGCAFALLTSPALLFAMQARRLLGRFPIDVVTGGLAIFVGALALCRGFASAEVIPHLILNDRLHLVVY